LVLHAQQSDVRMIRWALVSLPKMEKATCVQLAANAKSGSDASPALVSAIDGRMKNFVQRGWIEGAVDPTKIAVSTSPGTSKGRCFVFCLDVSWSMLFGNDDMQGIGKAPGQGGKWQRSDGKEFFGVQVNQLDHLLPKESCRLDTSCQSIRNLCRDHVRKGDMLGFMSFGGEQKWEFAIQKVNDPNVIDTALANVATTTTGTAFFSSVVACIETLSGKTTGLQDWVIALTDGDDNKSTPDAIDQACRLLRDGETNIAIITVGKLSDKTLQPVHQMCAAAQAKGSWGKSSQGLHFVAENSDKIASAFQQVAHAISVTAEAL